MNWLREQLRIRLVQKNLSKFKAITQLMREQRMRNERADAHHAEYLFRKSAQTWFAHYARGQPLYSRLSHYKRKSKLQSKRSFFKVWIVRSKAALQRVRSAQRVNKCLNRLDKKRAFLRWVVEANFLIRLSNAEIQAAQHFSRKRASRALRHFSEVT